MIKVALLDDNVSELSNMAQLLDLYSIEKNISIEYGVFNNGLDLISSLEKGKTFDVFCLDIIMPGFTGIETAREIRGFDKNAPILFFTSSTEYAYDSYSVKAINYVLKPVTKEKFFFIFNELIEQRDAVKEDESLIIRTGEGIQKLLIANLTYLEVMGRSVFYHLNSGKTISCNESFSKISDKLLALGCFLKPHRSYLVNMKYLDTIKDNQITLLTGDRIPVAQGKTKGIRETYLSYQMKED